MIKNWNKTYNQNGFNLENARKMELNAEDLMILRWFLDFYPLMERVCVDNKEYGWVHYGYLLHNLQIIYCKEESVAKRFHRYCELGLIEKTVKNTKQGRKVYFRAVENIILLYTSHTDKNLDAHTDKNLDAHTDKNLDAHTDKNLDNSSTIYPSTIYPSTINSNKDTASGFSQSNYSEIPNSSVVKENLTTQKQKDSELKTKQEVQEFVSNFKAKEVIIDGILQTAPIFSENEIDLITEYILRRKKGHRAKVKNTQKALTGVLNDILQVMKEIPLEIIFEQIEGVYVNCGTAGDGTIPWQTIKMDNRFKNLKQKSTFNNQNANTNTVREYLENNEQRIRSFNPFGRIDDL